MDFTKLSSKDIRAMDVRKLSDNVVSLRKELVTLRMDVYNAGPQAKSKSRNMRKALARLLMVAAEKNKSSAGRTK
jgi:ribosomal protein L29